MISSTDNYNHLWHISVCKEKTAVAMVNFGALVSFYSCPFLAFLFVSSSPTHFACIVVCLWVCACSVLDNRFSPVVKKVIGERAISRKRKGEKVSE